MAPRNSGYGGSGDMAPVEAVIRAVEVKRPPVRVVWRNVVYMSSLHAAALYGLYLLPAAQYYTWIWAAMLYVVSCLGITAGAHRLWTHRSYKARLPFRVMLALFQTTAAQNDIIEWSRDHRVHHKYSETDADPHNAKRGFFFSHVGWLLCRKHPEVKAKGRLLDISDLLNDPVCRVQRKIYKPAVLLCCFALPALVPWWFWSENLLNAFFIASILRYVLALNATWCVNSVAHMWGNRPYDRHINPVENMAVTMAAVGEGFHNYHHTFPYDYETSEFGWKLNLTSLLIDFGAAIGQVYDRKKVSPEAVRRRMERTGDGSTGWFTSPHRADVHHHHDDDDDDDDDDDKDE